MCAVGQAALLERRRTGNFDALLSLKSLSSGEHAEEVWIKAADGAFMRCTPDAAMRVLQKDQEVIQQALDATRRQVQSLQGLAQETALDDGDLARAFVEAAVRN
eukprot:evm.model.scf_752.5 EVM.evm.TU.scf_752.5   scf_752:38374-40054(+)